MATKTTIAAATTIKKTPRPQPASRNGQALRLRVGRERCGGRLRGRPRYSYSSYSSYSLGVWRGRGGLVLPLSIDTVSLAFHLIYINLAAFSLSYIRTKEHSGFLPGKTAFLQAFKK